MKTGLKRMPAASDRIKSDPIPQPTPLVIIMQLEELAAKLDRIAEALARIEKRMVSAQQIQEELMIGGTPPIRETPLKR
jgi:hypothetical protein